MVYSRTPKTIEKVRGLLDEMVECDIDLEWSAENPKKTAYNIWQAIKYAVRSGKREFQKYAVLGSKYKISVTTDTVIAKLKPHTVINGTILRDVNDVIGVIGCAIGLKLKNMIFPDIKELSTSDEKILSNWCIDNNYEYNLTPRGLQLNG
jgi:hypothetical protein